MAAMMDLERTYIMIKPDGVQRGLIGDIVKRFEQKKRDPKWGMDLLPAGVGEGLLGEGDYGETPK